MRRRAPDVPVAVRAGLTCAALTVLVLPATAGCPGREPPAPAGRSSAPVASDPASSRPNPASGRPDSAPGPSDPAAVASASASVVSVRTTDGRHRGAGFRVAIDGIVVTTGNAVASVPDGGGVLVVLRDGTAHPATVLGRDPLVDIAALRVGDGVALPPMHSGSGLAEARPGDPVFAVAAAAGPAPPVRAGTLRATRERAALSGRDRELVSTDVAVDPAHAGGPLIDAGGHVLGVTTALAVPIDAAGTTGYAVPVDVARAATFDIVEGR